MLIKKEPMPDKAKQIDFEEEVMAKVKSGRITLKPRWYFVAGSVISFISLVGLFIVAAFLTNVFFFTLRRHGPMGQWRLQIMLSDFPWWIAIGAVGGMVLGVWLLKKYDFSYKKNFLLIVIAFSASVIIAGWSIDQLGINETWSRRGPLKRIYHRMEVRENFVPHVRGHRFYRPGKRFNR